MDNFDALEAQLRARAGAVNAEGRSAAEALRPKVLAAMRAARTLPATPLWVFASGAAASVVLLLNLAISSVQSRPLVAVQVSRPDALAKELRNMVPELDEREALRQAFLLEARARTAESNAHQIPGSAFKIGIRSEEIEHDL